MGIYLDYNATSPLRKSAKLAFLDACYIVGNPSSFHNYGRFARSYVENARCIIRDYMDAYDAKIIFTSGGTESNNLAILGI